MLTRCLISNADGRSARALRPEIGNERDILCESDGPGEFSRLRSIRRLIGNQIVRRGQREVGWDIIEDFVISDTEAAPDYRRVSTEKLFGNARRIGEAHDRR